MGKEQVIQVTTSSFGEADDQPIKRLKSAGNEVRLNPYARKVSSDELRPMLADIDALIAGTEVIDEHVLSQAPRLKVISRVGVGMDAIDQAAVRRAGIRLFNTPSAHVDAVAELTVAFLLEGFRRHVASDRSIRRGRWVRPMGRLLNGKTVGFVGFGKVPQKVANMLAGFGVRLLAYDKAWDADAAAALDVEYAEPASLWKTSDAVSIHVPGDAGTIIGAAEFSAMKSSVVLLNTARGGLIDEGALLDFLKHNPESFAALDTFTQEPYSGPLAELDNTLLTAHLGGYSHESRIAMEVEAAENCLKGLEVNQ